MLGWNVGLGVAARSAERAGSVARTSPATATTRSDKRATLTSYCCVRTSNYSVFTPTRFSRLLSVLFFVRYFTTRVVPWHIVASGSCIRLDEQSRSLSRKNYPCTFRMPHLSLLKVSGYALRATTPRFRDHRSRRRLSFFGVESLVVLRQPSLTFSFFCVPNPPRSLRC